ncbi:MAG: type 1 glutamine amidotransferase [Verrucomicrobiota bacterium]
MRIHVLQHVSYEGPGMIEGWAGQNNCPLQTTRLYEVGVALPDSDDFDCLVVMGGPMGARDEGEYGWMVDEKRLIKEAIEEGKKVLGICLGSQLVASVLGAHVRRNQHEEIGWAPIWLTDEGHGAEVLGHMQSEMPVLHWHRDTFDIPSGAKHLIESAGCRNQAFMYEDRVLGLQFHMEMTRASLRALIDNSGELEEGPFVQSGVKMLAREENAFRRANHAMRGLLLRLANVH